MKDKHETKRSLIPKTKKSQLGGDIKLSPSKTKKEKESDPFKTRTEMIQFQSKQILKQSRSQYINLPSIQSKNQSRNLSPKSFNNDLALKKDNIRDNLPTKASPVPRPKSSLKKLLCCLPWGN